MLPDILLKTRAYQVLDFLTLNRDHSCYDKEISERAGVSRGATNKILHDFLANGLVTRERRGKMWFYSVNRDHPLITQFRIFENLVELSELSRQLARTAKRVVLFGSTARGDDTEESDVDLFVISDEPENAAAVIRKFPSRREIKPVIKTPVDYATGRARDKDFYDQVERGITLIEREIDEQRL